MHTGCRPLSAISFISLLLVIAFTVPGCTWKAYSGPELPPNQVATIKTHINLGLFTREQVGITAIDGKEGKTADYNISVKPGRHTLALRLYQSGSGGLVGLLINPGTATPLRVLSFDAEAGHTYTVHGEFGGSWGSSTPYYWIVDEETRQVIAGRRPE